jgi:hypothetical protein
LLELAMAVQGEKQLVASTASRDHSPLTALPVDTNGALSSKQDVHPYFAEIGARGLTAQAMDSLFAP